MTELVDGDGVTFDLSLALDQELDIHLPTGTGDGLGGAELHGSDQGVGLDFEWATEAVFWRTLNQETEVSDVWSQSL